MLTIMRRVERILSKAKRKKWIDYDPAIAVARVKAALDAATELGFKSTGPRIRAVTSLPYLIVYLRGHCRYGVYTKLLLELRVWSDSKIDFRVYHDATGDALLFQYAVDKLGQFEQHYDFHKLLH